MPSFKIIYYYVENAKAVPFDDWLKFGEIFPNAEVAKAKVKQLTDDHSYRNYSTGKLEPRYVFRMMPVPVEEDYGLREETRQKEGKYTLLPEVWQRYSNTYAYYDAEEKLVSFFDGESNLARDRRTTMKPTRYWHRYVGRDDMFQAMLDAKMLSGDFELKFARTREEIRHVYMNGPESCMSGEAGQYYSSKVHPVEAYASPDLELAYVTVGDEIISRALCNTKNKQYVRIYGDIKRTEVLLEEAGYSHNDYCLGGVRLLKIFGQREDHVDRNVVMTPYLDGCCTTIQLEDIDAEYMTIIPRKITFCGSTSGYASF